MTRINVVPVTELTDKHLLAEYRELPRVFHAAQEWYKQGGDPADLPDTYRLGTGHVKFFYCRLQFCYLRQLDLYKECRRRGFNVTLKPDFNHLIGGIDRTPSWMLRDYEPTPEALRINRERINTRLREASQRR
jgi:deoxyribonuclease (pyrimidine dimer)